MLIQLQFIPNKKMLIELTTLHFLLPHAAVSISGEMDVGYKEQKKRGDL